MLKTLKKLFGRLVNKTYIRLVIYVPEGKKIEKSLDRVEAAVVDILSTDVILTTIVRDKVEKLEIDINIFDRNNIRPTISKITRLVSALILMGACKDYAIKLMEE